jgi:hypothetical protein
VASAAGAGAGARSGIQVIIAGVRGGSNVFLVGLLRRPLEADVELVVSQLLKEILRECWERVWTWGPGMPRDSFKPNVAAYSLIWRARRAATRTSP